MNQTILQKLIPFLIHYRYALVFPVAVLEGPIITILTGFLTSQGIMDFKLALLTVAAGDLVGDILSYALGRFARAGLIHKYGHYIGIDQARLKKIESYILRNVKKTLIFGKFAHGLGYVTWIATGMVKLPFSTFLIGNTLTTAVKSTLLFVAGYFFGRAYMSFNSYLSYASWIMICLFVVVYVVAIKTDFFGKIIERID